MILNEDAVRRMIDISGSTATGSGSALGGGGGGIPAGNFVSTEYYNQNFTLVYKQETTDGTTGDVTTAFLTAAPNVIPTVGTETDTETGDVIVTSLIGQKVLNALVIGDILMEWDETNNAIKVVKQDGTAANFYATGGVSALGANSGGGGGADLNALLDSINTSSIGSITPGASNVGKCLVWTADGWAWGTTGEGGGGTVTAITAGTGLSGGTITTSGTIAISSNYQARIALGETAYGWGNHADAGYATQQWVNQQGFLTSSAISDMATKTWVGQQGFLTSSAIADMATKTWVNQQNFLTSETYTGTVTSVGLSMPTGFSVSNSPVTSSGTLSVGIATGYFIPTTTQRTTWNGKQDAISDLATIRSGAAAGATAVQPSAISDMATQTWVGQQGYITASALTSYLPLTGGTLTGALHMGSAAGASPYIYWGDSSYAYIGEDSDDHITLRGDNGVNILTGSRYELEWNGNTLATQAWVNSQGYMLRTEGMRFTDYGTYIAARFVLANGTYDATRSGKAQGTGFIEWWSTGGYFNHRMGSVSIYDGVNDDTCYLQIGGGRIYWDPSSKSLYVVQSDGSTPANLYATGGVSALGISTGGTPSVSALTVGTLNATTGNVTTLNVNGVARFNDDIIINVGGTDMYLDLDRCVELGILS